MATKLSQPVHRQLMSTDRKGRAIIVSLIPGDMLEFRPKGSKRRMTVYIGHCVTLAQIMTVNMEYKQAMEKYNSDRSCGIRRRKPSKPALPFGKMYLDALK